jgi:hypothetical protein
MSGEREAEVVTNLADDCPVFLKKLSFFTATSMPPQRPRYMSANPPKEHGSRTEPMSTPWMNNEAGM